MKVTRETLARKFFDMYATGLNYQDIADRTGYSKQYVSQTLLKFYPDLGSRRTQPVVREDDDFLTEEEELILEQLERTFSPDEIEVLTRKRFD